MMKIGIAAFAAATLASAAPAATPDTALAKDAAVLDLKGLDLSSVDGQRRLAIRVDQAARTVCGDRLSTIHLELGARERVCRADVAADVRQQIEARIARAQAPAATRLASAR